MLKTRHAWIPTIPVAVYVARTQAASYCAGGNLCDMSQQIFLLVPFHPQSSPFLPPFFGMWRHIILISFVMNTSPFDIKTIYFRSKMRILFKFPSSVCCHGSFSPPTPIRSPLEMTALEMLFPDATILYVYGALWRHKDKDSHSSHSTALA